MTTPRSLLWLPPTLRVPADGRRTLAEQLERVNLMGDLMGALSALGGDDAYVDAARRTATMLTTGELRGCLKNVRLAEERERARLIRGILAALCALGYDDEQVDIRRRIAAELTTKELRGCLANIPGQT